MSRTRRTSSRRASKEDTAAPAGPLTRRVVEDLTTCPLCRGAFRNVHTINECLHSFCLACLESQWGYSKEGSRTNTPRASSRGCPTCSISLGPQPYSFVICDRKLQTITEKITEQLEACASAGSSDNAPVAP